jgi:hypothetical protein
MNCQADAWLAIEYAGMSYLPRQQQLQSSRQPVADFFYKNMSPPFAS